MVRRLLALNGIAAIFAVVHHSVNWGITAMFWWAPQYRTGASVPDYAALGGLQYFAIRAIDQVVVSAVPAFLFVSGYFVASSVGARPTLAWDNVVSRVRTLLPAYLLWSLLVIGFNMVNGAQYTWSRVAWALVTGGAAAPFYYVPLVVELYVLSRWLAPWVRRSAGLVLLVTGLAQASVALVRSCSVAALDACTPDHAVARLAVNSQLLSYCFWFALGLAASFHMPAFKATLRRLRPVLPWLLVALFVAAAGEWEVVRRLSGRTWVPSGVGIGDNLFELALLLTYLAHDDGPLPWAAPLERVGVMSYGIYLVHMPVLEVAARVLYHLSPFLLAYQVVLMAAVSAVGVGAPMLLMRFAKSSPLRRYYAYAFG